MPLYRRRHAADVVATSSQQLKAHRNGLVIKNQALSGTKAGRTAFAAPGQVNHLGSSTYRERTVQSADS